MAQISITDNINALNDVIFGISDKINSITLNPSIKIKFQDLKEGMKRESGSFLLLTNRQIAKKLIMFGGNVGIQSLMNQVPPPDGVRASDFGLNTTIDEETAHLIVYGKPMIFVDGKLIDNEITNPECVGPDPGQDSRIKTMAKDSTMMNMAKQMKQELVDSARAFGIKFGEIISTSKDIPPQIALASVALASAVVIMPFGSGLPGAVTAVKNLLASITSLITKLSQLLSILTPLKYLPILVPSEIYNEINMKIDEIFSKIMIPLMAINNTLGLITGLMALIPKIPGADPGVPSESVEADLKVSTESINRGESSTIDVSASKGSWEYLYYWSSVPSGFVSNLKSVKVSPYETTKYFIKISDKKNPNNKITKSVTIKVF